MLREPLPITMISELALDCVCLTGVRSVRSLLQRDRLALPDQRRESIIKSAVEVGPGLYQ
jgi:hypothetical protein